MEVMKMITLLKATSNFPINVGIDEDSIYIQYQTDDDFVEIDRNCDYTIDDYSRLLLEFFNKVGHRKIYLGMGIKRLTDIMIMVETLLGNRLKGADKYEVESKGVTYKVRYVGNNLISIVRVLADDITHGYFEYTNVGKLASFYHTPKSEEDLPTYQYISYEDFLKYYGDAEASSKIYDIISKRIDYSLGKPINFQPPTEFCGLIDAEDINDNLATYIEDMIKLLSPNIPAREIGPSEETFFRPVYEILCEKSPIAMFPRAKYMESFTKVHQVYSTSPAMLIKLADLYVLCMVVDNAFFKNCKSYDSIMIEHEMFATTIDRFRRFIMGLHWIISIIAYRHPLYFVFSLLALLEGHNAAKKAMRDREERELKLVLRGKKFGEGYKV